MEDFGTAPEQPATFEPPRASQSNGRGSGEMPPPAERSHLARSPRLVASSSAQRAPRASASQSNGRRSGEMPSVERPRAGRSPAPSSAKRDTRASQVNGRRSGEIPAVERSRRTGSPRLVASSSTQRNPRINLNHHLSDEMPSAERPPSRSSPGERGSSEDDSLVSQDLFADDSQGPLEDEASQDLYDVGEGNEDWLQGLIDSPYKETQDDELQDGEMADGEQYVEDEEDELQEDGAASIQDEEDQQATPPVNRQMDTIANPSPDDAQTLDNIRNARRVSALSPRAVAARESVRPDSDEESDSDEDLEGAVLGAQLFPPLLLELSCSRLYRYREEQRASLLSTALPQTLKPLRAQ